MQDLQSKDAQEAQQIIEGAYTRNANIAREEALGFDEFVETQREPSLAKDIMNLPTDIYTGISKGINESLSLIESVTDYLPRPTMLNEEGETGFPRVITTGKWEERMFKKTGVDLTGPLELPTLERDDKGLMGEGVTAIAQFLTGLKGVNTTLKGLGVAKATTKAGKTGEAIAKGTVADLISFDEHDQRLSNVIEQFPALQNPVTEYLQADASDNLAEGKFKQALEGAAIGGAGEALFRGISALKKTKAAAQDIDAETFIKEQDEAAQRASNAYRSKLNEANLEQDEAFRISTKLSKAEAEAKGIAPEDIKSGKMQEPEIFINFDRIEGPDQIKEVMENMANDPNFLGAVKTARRGVRSDEALLKEANDINGFNELMTRRTGEALNDSQTVAARTLYYKTTSKLMELAKVASSPEATQLDQFAFRKMMALHNAVQKEVLGARAEAARSLRAWSIPVGGEDAQMIKNMEEILNQYGGEIATKDLATRLSEIGNRATTAQINQITEKGALARTGGAMLEAWQLGLLTNPTTHVVNISSNTLTGLYLGLEKGVDAIQGARPLAEAVSYFQGYFGSMKEALASAGKAYTSGEVRIGTKVDLPFERRTAKEVLDPLNKGGYITDAVNGYGKILEHVSGKVLAAGDAFGKTLLYKAELRSLAMREGAKKGLQGKELKEFIADKIANPTRGMDSDAFQFAEYGTYVKPLGSTGQSVQRAISSMPALRLVMPFVRTPANIFKFTYERTPLAVLSSSIREDLAAGGARAAQARSRMGLGTFVGMLGMDFAVDGKITGAGPSDPKIRAALRNSGWQPYSIKIGDEYYAYSRMEPIATIMGMAADIAEITTNYDAYDVKMQEETEKLWTSLAIVAANQVVGKTFLSGIADMSNMLADPTRYGNQFINRFIGSTVPAGVAGMERTLSPEMEYVQNGIDAIRARIPFLSEGVAKRRDAFGKVISYIPMDDDGQYSPIARSIQMINPIYYSKDKNDYVVYNILNNGNYVPDVSPSQGFALEPQDLTQDLIPYAQSVRIDLKEYPEIFDDFKKTRGQIKLPLFNNQNYYNALRDVIDGQSMYSYEYNNPMTTLEDKQRILNNISTQYTKETKKMMLEKYPELRIKAFEEIEKIKRTTDIAQ